jgi:hypothetical protein
VIALFFGLYDALSVPRPTALVSSIMSSIGPVAIVLAAGTIRQSVVALAAVIASLTMILLGTIATYSPVLAVAAPCLLVLVGVGIAFVLYSHRVWTDVQSLRASSDEIRYLPRLMSRVLAGPDEIRFLPDDAVIRTSATRGIPSVTITEAPSRVQKVGPLGGAIR